MGCAKIRCIIGLCHLSPRLKNEHGLQKSKTLVRKKSNYELDLQKNLMVKDGNCKLLVTCGAYMYIYVAFLSVSAS